MAKAPAEIRSLARAHTQKAVNVLVGIMQESQSPPAARVHAASVLLDRGWGKPAQAHAGEGGEGPVKVEVTWKAGES